MTLMYRNSCLLQTHITSIIHTRLFYSINRKNNVYIRGESHRKKIILNLTLGTKFYAIHMNNNIKYISGYTADTFFNFISY